jgi:TPR repeat protein
MEEIQRKPSSREQRARAAYVHHKAKAKSGNRQSQYIIGRCLKEGTGVTKNVNKAFKYLAKAASQNHQDA